MIGFTPGPSVEDLEILLDRARVDLECAERIDSWPHRSRKVAEVRKRIDDLEAQLAAATAGAERAPAYRLQEGAIQIQRLKGGRWEAVEDPDALLAHLSHAAKLLKRIYDEPLTMVSDFPDNTPLEIRLGSYRPDLSEPTAHLLEELGL